MCIRDSFSRGENIELGGERENRGVRGRLLPSDMEVVRLEGSRKGVEKFIGCLHTRDSKSFFITPVKFRARRKSRIEASLEILYRRPFFFEDHSRVIPC